MGDLVTAASSGDKRATLTALRDLLANEIEVTTSGRDLAALTRQLTDVLRQLDEVPDKEEVNAANDIAKRRAERRNKRRQSDTATESDS